MPTARCLYDCSIENTKSIPELGTNAKMNEFEAAMGLCLLDEMEEVSQKRKDIYERYENTNQYAGLWRSTGLSIMSGTLP